MEDFSVRLKKAMDLRKYKPVNLVEKTGLDKSQISCYLSGKYKAKQDKVYILAKALNVSESWLLGFDVPIERIPDDLRDNNIFQYTVTDSAMLPLLDKGDIAYIHKQSSYISEETILFTLNDVEYIRKILVKNGIIEFQAMNPYYPIMKYTKEQLKDNNFSVIGKVVKAENKSAFK